MIFLDESGKRWKHIKFGTGVLSTTVLVPIGVLATASLLYFPAWGGFALPSPFHVSNPQKTIQPSVLSATNSKPAANASKRTTTSAKSSASPTAQQTANNASTTTGQSASNSPADSTSQPLVVTPVTTPTPTTTPAGQANKPLNPGNSTYGQSHQPTKT